MPYRSLTELPAAQGDTRHIVRSGLAGDLPGELRETVERGNHLIALMPAGRSALRFRAQLRGIGIERVAVLELSLGGAVIASARFDLGKVETVGIVDCDAECRSAEGFIELELAFAERTQPRFFVLALLRDGALTYEGDPAHGILLRTIELGSDEIENTEPEQRPRPIAAAPAEAEPLAARGESDRMFHAQSQWLDLTRGETGHSYAWRSGRRRHGAVVLVRARRAVQFRLESDAAPDDIVELTAPRPSSGAAAVVEALARQLTLSIRDLDDGEMRDMARSAMTGLDRLVAPLFSDSAEAMLSAER